jgi:hypothetical protein
MRVAFPWRFVVLSVYMNSIFIWGEQASCCRFVSFHHAHAHAHDGYLPMDLDSVRVRVPRYEQQQRKQVRYEIECHVAYQTV